MKQIRILILPAIFVFNIYILLFKPEWLGIALLNNPPFPLGTLVSWVLLAVLPVFVFQAQTNQNKKTGLNRRQLLVTILLFSGLLWGVVSWMLSGNWTFNFSSKNCFVIWIIYSASIIFSSVAILILLLLRKLFFNK